MTTYRSRYQASRALDPPPPGMPQMQRPRDIDRVEEVLEHTVVSGDRFDLLAQHYYGDARLWWRILDANPQLVCASELEDPGMQGRIIVIPGGGS